MVDYLAGYMEDIDRRRVFTEVQPDYLREMLQKTAPGKGEQWENIIRDVNNTIMPGVSKKKSYYCFKFKSQSMNIIR